VSCDVALRFELLSNPQHMRYVFDLYDVLYLRYMIMLD
jgi:hypothetical protein